MKASLKTIWKIVAILAALASVLAVALLVVLQSAWFRDQVRKRIIAQVESATGGKVEIGAFNYNWQTLTANLQGFVIHGTEAPPAAPLLRVESAGITVRVISILKRSADISSIVLTRPQVNLIVAPNGSTNLPTPKVIHQRKDPITEIFALKLNHFVIANGLVVANDKRYPLNVRGDGVELAANYLKSGPSYALSVSSRQVDFGFNDFLRGPFTFNASASIGQDRVLVQKVELTGVSLQLAGSAVLEHFANPSLNFQMDAASATNEIVPLAKFTYVRGGKLSLHGAGHYDENQGWSFNGKAGAQQTRIEATVLTLQNVNASADVDVDRSGLVLRHIAAAAVGAKFTGDATLKNYRDLSYEGNLSGLALPVAASFFTNRPLPWQGVAAGRVHGAATLDSRTHDFSARATLQISPSSNAIPVSGNVDLTYLEKSNSLDFGPSHLSFPHSSLSLSGSLWGRNQVVLDSGDLEDLKPIVPLLNLNMSADVWPVLQTNGNFHFDGTISNLLNSPQFDGQAKVSAVRFEKQVLDEVTAKFNASNNGVDFTSLDVHQGATRINGSGLVGLTNWLLSKDSPIRAAIAIHGLDVAKAAALVTPMDLPIIQGIASGTLQLRGTFAQPEGKAHISSDSLDAYGERLNQAQFDADLVGNHLQISNGRVASGSAILNFSGEYEHRPLDWLNGQARAHVDSNGFPLASLSPFRKYEPAFNGRAEVHLDASAIVGPGKFEATGATGTVQLSNVTWNKVPYGDFTLNSATHGQSLDAVITGDFRKNLLHGTAKVALSPGNHTNAEIAFDRVNLTSLYSLTGADTAPPFDGVMAAKIDLEGSLQDPAAMRVSFTSDKLELSSRLNPNEPGKQAQPEFTFHNEGPLLVDLFQGVATVRSFRIEGDQTGLEISGAVPLDTRKPLDLKVAGTVNLQAYHLFDPHVQSSGVSVIAANVGGTFADPTITGAMEVKNGSFVPENIPNGLSEVNGTVNFTRNRATLQKMTAKSGGGELALSGFLSFAGGGPLVYHLEGSAENVRVRYAGSISVTVSSKLRLSGTSTNSVVAGTLTVSRVIFNPNTDVGNLLAGLSAANAAPGGENDFLTGLHLDVGIESSPNLQLSTALSHDVEAEINLRLRGTPEHPVLIGNLAANQGDIQAFGNRYSINRGEISFANPVKIEPTLDLDLETRARGVTIDITLSGTFSKLNIAYRSDPPLQPREIIALLSLGRTPDSTDSTKTLRTNDTNTLQSGANSLLGAVVTSPVSNRLSKLFGITNIRIDPLVQGITNTPQTRVTLEQQISRDITITYVTNLSQTSEQIFRFEWAFSRQFSVVALRDDNGEFGIDFQYKKQFK
jgi:translocation and assembly module TamB